MDGDKRGRGPSCGGLKRLLEWGRRRTGGGRGFGGDASRRRGPGSGVLMVVSLLLPLWLAPNPVKLKIINIIVKVIESNILAEKLNF